MIESTPAPEPVLLQVDDLAVVFGQGAAARTAVDGVSFSVSRGEKFAIVGESGSGKSVTALSILRLHDPRNTHYTRGKINFDGRDLLRVPVNELRRVRGKDVAVIFQEPMTSLNPVLTIGEQLCEPLVLHEGLTGAAARTRAAELLARMGIRDAQQRLNSYPHMLSGGQRQRVMIAMAIACKPRLLIADEPTTALDVTIQFQIIQLLEELQREMGMAVLIITHDLHLVRRFADRICVMQHGRIVEANDVPTLFAQPQQAYTRQLLDSQPETLGRAGAGPGSLGVPVMEGRRLRCVFEVKSGMWQRKVGEVRAVDDVDVHIHTGETVGIVGESGSGKTTLGMCLFRLRTCSGDILFQGKELGGVSEQALRSQRRDFQVVFQDPYSSLSPRQTVENIVGEGLLIHQRELTRVQRRQRVCEALREVGLGDDALDRFPHQFSGGQRQRIAIARAVIMEPKLILLDEPTSALDVSVQKQVLVLLRELQLRRGMAYLFITHDLRVIRTMAHRIIVMKDGKIVEQNSAESLFTAPRHPYTQSLLQAAFYTAV